MHLHRTQNGTVDVIRLPKRLTMADAATYRHEIRDLVDGGHIHLVMEMCDVEFVDSSGQCSLEVGDEVQVALETV